MNNLLENSVDIGGKVGESLRANIDSVRLNRELTQLVSDLQLSVEVKNLEWLGINIAEISNFFEKLEIRALKDRVKSLPQIGGQSTNEIEINVRQLNSKEINDLLLNRKTPIAVFVEIQEGKVISYSVALSESEVIDSSEISFGDWILDPQLPKYVHGAKKLLKVIKLDGLIADIELLAYLVNPGSRNLELTDLAQRLLGVSESSQSLFSDFNPKSAAWIYRIYNELQNEITTMGMNSLYTEIEQPTLLLLSKMESVGIAVDKEELKSLATHFSQIVNDQTKLAHKEAGHEFNVSSPKQLQTVLFDELNLPKTKKIKTGFTTDAESLDWLFAKTQHQFSRIS